MHAINALIGSVRLVSSSMLVQVRGRGLSLSLAFMLSAVASLCLFDPTEANAHPRTLLRKNVPSEPEGSKWPIEVYDVNCDQVEYSNGPECVTKAEGNIDVEYCFGRDKVNATEASKRCAEKSSALVETEELPRILHDTLSNSPLLTWEFWVDLRKEDVRKVAGVVAFDVDDIDWNMPCVTVSFGVFVPWFYKRNCSQLYPVMCSSYDGRGPRDHSINVRVYCDYLTSRSTYCLSERGTMNKKAASEFCANLRWLLLNAKTFYAISDFYFVFKALPDPLAYPRFEYWDARSTSSRQDSIDECLAVELSEFLWYEHYFPQYNRIPRNCSEELGYICRKSHPPKTHGFTCENTSLPNMGRHPACRTNLEKPYPEAATVCDALGMDLLPGTVENKFITNIIKHYEDYTHRGRDRHYWLDVPKPSVNSSLCTAALYGDDGVAAALSEVDCNTSLHSLCVFTNIERHSAVAPSTSETTMDIASDNTDIGNGTVSDVAS
ncbi:uncharacterized protein [Dermacentor albipictus]|uniref:uncharacterized protein isoform X2 n=1 Tax=Dermacentor albipictus TaxID=60249 RepID=UPI0031FCAF41